MYLKQYDDFIIEVKNNYEQFSVQDWVAMDERFRLYSRTYYDKFHKELSKGEKIQTNLYRVEYLKYKALHKADEMWKKLEDFVFQPSPQ